MKTMSWLLRREYWEHRGGMFWTPAVIGSLMAGVTLLTIVIALVSGKVHGVHINGVQLEQLSELVTPELRTKMAEGIVTMHIGTAMPMLIAMSFVVFFFCLSALYDDRSDRSVLFWKSLPISDRATVLSKLLTALVVAPLITLALATITSYVLILLMCATALFGSVNLFGLVFGQPRTYALPLELLAVVPVYFLWALPAAGWLLMVSAWARTKPLLWAVGVPAIIGGLASWIDALFDLGFDLRGLWHSVVGRLLLSEVPGSWLLLSDRPEAHAHGGLQNASPLAYWNLLTTPELWIGVVAGVAMLVIAMRLRRYRDEG